MPRTRAISARSIPSAASARIFAAVVGRWATERCRSDRGTEVLPISTVSTVYDIYMYVCQYPSFRLLENLPPDQHAPDLAGAGADLVELGVAQQAPGREVVDVAVAAQALDRLERHPGPLLGGEQDGAGRVLPGGLAAVAGARDR